VIRAWHLLSVAGLACVLSGCEAVLSLDEKTDLPEDSGQTQPEASAADSAPDRLAEDAETDSSVCEVDANVEFTTEANCYSCIETTCSSQLSACNANCTCKTDLVAILACMSSGGNDVSCLGSVPGFSQGLVDCVAGPAVGGPGPGCLAACGASVPEAGTDAASDAPRDAPGDALDDGPADAPGG
jgi:hypothetical protein